MATRMEESFLRRKASPGGSSMATTWLAGWMLTRARRRSDRFSSSGAISSGKPTSIASSSGCRRSTASAADTGTAGALSPPMASIARVNACDMKTARGLQAGRPALRRPLFLVLDRDGLEHLLAAIETVRGNVVTTMRLAAGRVDRQRRLAERIVRAQHVALRGTLSILLYSHGG